MISVAISAFLGACTYFDVKERKIPVWLLLAGGVGGVVCMLSDGLGISDLIAMLPGLLMLGVAFCTDQAGTGDGCMLLVLGGFLGFWKTLQVLLTGMLLCVVAGLLRKLWKKKSWQQDYPLAPFLLAAFWTTLI